MHPRPHIGSILLALLALGACAPHLPRERPLEAPAAVARDWQAIFAAPRPVEVVSLVTGEIRVDRSLLLDVASPRLADHDDRKVWVPVLAHVIRHREHGAVLVDTGFDASFAESGHGNIGGLARFLTIARQPPGHDVAALLRRAGVDPASLRMIIISHLHIDHTAGLPDLPKEVPLHAGPYATRHYEHMWYAPTDHFRGFAEVHTFDFTGLPADGPGPAIDLFGDGSLFVVSTPGHAEGNLSFVVNGTGGPVLLTCDASHTQEGFRRRVGPGKVIDRTAADATIERLAGFAAAHPRLRVKAGHDAEDWDLARPVQDPL